jgi:methylmalonyl-CoA mutase
LSAFNTRATFARNAFEAGGIEAVTNEGGGAHRPQRLGGGDRLLGIDRIRRAQAGDARAGLPEGLRAAGVAHDLYAGCDLVKLLAQAQEAA